MSLTDKVIKNTFYHFASQMLIFVMPLLLTPFILSKVGQEHFGIYVLIPGIVGIFNLFDFSISVSFIKLFSDDLVKEQYNELNNTVNSGFIFYFLFSTLLLVTGLIFTPEIISYLKIEHASINTAIKAFRIYLLIFYIATSTTVFVSLLISINKLYVISITNIFLTILSAAATIIFLQIGYGITSIFIIQLISVILSTVINIFWSLRSIPQLKLSFSNLKLPVLKKMFTYGSQLQVSKAAGFLSERYEEFLLGTLTIIGNVTSYNIAGKLARAGRFFPYQLYIQAAPAAAELNAKNEQTKLELLFEQISKYYLISTIPIFTFLFVFADNIIFVWIGGHYPISVLLLRTLIIGQVFNLIFSLPGNSIFQNIGKPKFPMKEGIIFLAISLILSYILIIKYDIFGAAIGSTIALAVSSIYIFISSIKFFKVGIINYIKNLFLKPLLCSSVTIVIVYSALYFSTFSLSDRKITAILLIICGVVFVILYLIILKKSKYFTALDYMIFRKLFAAKPFQFFNRFLK